MKFVHVLAGCSLFAIAGAAQAQVGSSGNQAGTSAAPAPVPGDETPPEAAAEQGGVGDIVVTANRREERLQAVPVTVSLVDGSQLTRQNINAVEDLSRSAPALNTAGPPGFGALSIRGIGGLTFSRSSEGSVGVVVDGVSLANTSTNPPLLFDVARVEVLEGPQGTLFGRNSSAGVINIVTNAPDPSRVEVIAHADIGSRNNYIARGAVNLPVAANAALRVTGSYSQDPQVQRNRFDGTYLRREAKAGRARFLWEPGSGVTINLAADYTDSDVNGGTPWAVYSSIATSLLTARLNACGVQVGPKNQEGCVNPNNVTSATSYGFSGQIDVDLGGPTLTSITAMRRVRTNNNQDVDSTTANRLFQATRDRINNFSQELRISSPGSGTIQYVGGLFYFKSNLNNVITQSGQVLADLPLIRACPLPAAALCGLTFGQARPSSTSTESYAAFGQATIKVADRLRFILGGRLGREDVRSASPGSTTVAGALAAFAPSAAISARATDTYFSYRVGVQYDVTSDIMAFATYTRGYKGPATNDTAASAAAPLLVKPEIPKSGEVGFKATLPGGRAAFNATAFYTRVDNFQAQFFDASIPAFVFGNAPELTSKGVSAQLFGRPARGLTTNLGVTYLDAKYGEGYSIANFRNVVTSAQGKQLIASSKWSITASGEYSTAVSDTISGFVQADMVYRSKQFFNATNDAILSERGAAIFGGRIGLRTTDQQFGVSVFTRNLFNTFRASTRFATPIAAQQLDPLSFSQFAGPESRRVIGLSLDARF
jgi:iron complex outermembrane receptor protein